MSSLCSFPAASTGYESDICVSIGAYVDHRAPFSANEHAELEMISHRLISPDPVILQIPEAFGINELMICGNLSVGRTAQLKVI